MDADMELHPETDDLPLRANTKHILVRHYVLDLTIHFDRNIISGNVVLFLEPIGAGERAGTREVAGAEAGAEAEAAGQRRPDSAGDGVKEHRITFAVIGPSFVLTLMVFFGLVPASSVSWESSSDGEDFTLVLDCCDLSVSKVEEVDITSVLQTDRVTPVSSGSTLADTLMSMPSQSCRVQHQLYSQCSQAPSVQGEGQLRFYTDRWSLQVRKKGVVSASKFPRVLRIFYETRPAGCSVRWTHDQDDRSCLYTAGSPINNRALFPCQEPPVAMSTWQAAVRAPADCVVLMSGQAQALPRQESSFSIWSYYVTMPMPASTLALAVGHWQQVTAVPPCGSYSDSAGSMDKSGTGPREGSICDIATDLRTQLSERSKDYIAYSLAVDESTDMTDTAQLAIFIHGVDSNLRATEEIMDIKLMHGTTREDIFENVCQSVTDMKLPWDKLIGLTTDGAPAICGEKSGVVGRMRVKMQEENCTRELTAYHCIIHQEALCGKVLKMDHVMSTVTQTVNFI
uniref:Uncharacterized protein n=1 Tax=Periophthalmus magnuspinnatus TaxID=409849 RepID=A0A3B4AJP6_9GOBI